jgi:hypothetical protein
MSRDPKVYAALVIACAGLTLSIHTALREPVATTAPGAAYVEQRSRDQIEQLRRALAERDAMIARLARPPVGLGSSPPGADVPPVAPAQQPSASRDLGPQRFAHFNVPNPAVSVTQKADGLYDIRTTDPALAGTVIQVSAVTESGEEVSLLLRIPQ